MKKNLIQPISVKGQKVSKSLIPFNTFIRLADFFGLDQCSREKLVQLLNEPPIESFDLLALQECLGRIIELFEIEEEFFMECYEQECHLEWVQNRARVN